MAHIGGESPVSSPMNEDRPWRSLCIFLLIAGILVCTRSFSISQAHTETYDVEKYLLRGVRFWHGTLGKLVMDNPPLGPGIATLPIVIAGRGGAWPPLSKDGSYIWEYPISAQAILSTAAVWQSILFLPLVGIAFWWCRSLYGRAAGYFAATALIVEPTFAAHIPILGTDVLGTTAIIVGCYLWWRYVGQPGWRTLTIAVIGTTAAMMIKFTGIIVPIVGVAYIVITRFLKIREGGLSDISWKQIGKHALAAPIIFCIALWALTLFNISQPVYPGVDKVPSHMINSPAVRLFSQPWPAGSFIRSMLSAYKSSSINDVFGYLHGETRAGGWWYYFPAVATFKVPIGIGVFLLIGVASLAWVRPRRAELGLMIPLIIAGAMMLTMKVNIGFRHALPQYALLILFASRIGASKQQWPVWIAGLGILIGGIHGLTVHPDYLSYINRPYHKPYLQINDSNVDWGQSLKEVRDWIDAHQRIDRPIYIGYFSASEIDKPRHYLGDHAIPLERTQPPPTSGMLIISPIWEAGLYDPEDRYAFLRPIEPIDIIGHAMRVYDLDRLKSDGSAERKPQ